MPNYTPEMRAADAANGCYRCEKCLRGFWTKRGLTLHAPKCADHTDGITR